MKVLLVQPPVEDFYTTEIRLQPLGLCYLKAIAKKYHPDVVTKVLDFQKPALKKTIPLPKELAYLKNWYPCADKSPFCTFYQFYHFGLSFLEIAKILVAEDPDLIAITCLATPYYESVLSLAREIKTLSSIPILAGGSGVSAIPEFFIEDPSLDYLLLQEGERPFKEFLDFFKGLISLEEVSGLVSKKEGKFVFNLIKPNFFVKEIPVADFSDLDPKLYLFEKKPLAFLLTSRGCPHKCSFCSVHITFSGGYRTRSVEDVMEEIELRYHQGYRVIDFEDDNLTWYQDQMEALLDQLIEKFFARPIEFVAMNGISYLSLNENLLKKMQKAGFSRLNLALVSSDQSVLHSTKRPHTVKKYLDIVKIAADLGMKITSYQILGLPGEKLESMIQTLAFNSSLPVLLGASMFYLTPGSAIAAGFAKPQKKDLLRSRMSAMAIETTFCTRDQQFSLFVTTRIINFLKSLKSGQEKIVSLNHALKILKKESKRSALGVKQIQELFSEGILYLYPEYDKKTPHPRFDFSLFLQVWNKILEYGGITTQEGARIQLDSQPKS